MLRAYIAILLFVSSHPAFADTVTLQNGDRITGQVVSKTTNTLKFKTSYAGTLKINWQEIRELQVDKPVLIMLRDDTLIEDARIDTIANQQLVISNTTSAEPVNLKFDEVKYINPPVELSGRGVKIKGRFTTGLSISSGNTENEAYNINTEVVFRTLKDRYTVAASLFRASSENSDTEDKSSINLKYDHFLSKHNYLYANTSFAQDKFKDLRLKSTLGGGYGHQFVESDDRNLLMEAGLNYVNDDFFLATDDDYLAGRWALKYDNWLFSKRLQFFHNHEGLLDLEDNNNVTVTSETGLRSPILPGVNAAVQLNLDWDNQPADGTDSTDRKLLFILDYLW